MGQIQQLYMKGLVWKCFDIIQFLSKQNCTIFIKKIIYNSFYTIIETINGGDSQIKVEIMLYQDYQIVDIISYVIKNIIDIKNEIYLLDSIGMAMNELIIIGDANLEQEALKKFKNKLIINGMEEMIDNIIFNNNITEDSINNYSHVKMSLKE